MRTGRCDDFARGRGDDRRAARAARTRSREPLGLALGATGTHPWSPLAGPADHRHAALPPERRAPPLRRLAQQHASACTSTSASAAPTARSPSATRCASFLPELLALSASSPFVEDVDTGLHSARTQIFTRMFPRCGIPDAVRRLGRVRGLRPLPLRHRLDRRAHPALVERPPAPRLPDGRDPDLRRAARPRPRRSRSPRSAYALAARMRARASTRASRSRPSRTGCSRRTSGARSATGSRAS